MEFNYKDISLVVTTEPTGVVKLFNGASYDNHTTLEPVTYVEHERFKLEDDPITKLFEGVKDDE